MSIIKLAAVFAFTVLTAGVLPALAATPGEKNDISNFRYYSPLEGLDLKAPSVVEYVLDGSIYNRQQFAVQDVATRALEPYQYRESYTGFPKPAFSVSSEQAADSTGNMSDNDRRTYSSFAVPQSGQGLAELALSGSDSITATGLSLQLDNHVALPNYIEVRAVENGTEKIVLARSEMKSGLVYFPETSSVSWRVRLWYAQPLRISEISFIQNEQGGPIEKRLRFLAQPGQHYKIFFDADRFNDNAYPESGNLFAAKNVLTATFASPVPNPGYVVADSDKDGVPDVSDNCISVSNASQADLNANGIGDACEDFDFDGLANTIDNCPNIANADQSDSDGDKVGDVCDREESRVTEKHKWLPWAGIGFAAAVIAGLSVMMAMHKSEDK